MLGKNENIVVAIFSKSAVGLSRFRLKSTYLTFPVGLSTGRSEQNVNVHVGRSILRFKSGC